MPGGQSRTAGPEPAPLPPAPSFNRRYVVVLTAVAALGGLLFGYDTGVISGALLFLRRQFAMDPTMQGAVTASVLLGAVVGAAASGSLNDRFGRRVMLIAAALLFGAGAVLTALAATVSVLVAGRVVVGVGIGVASYTSPLYISESAPARVRGALVSTSQLAITVGIVVAYLVDYAFAHPGGWRWMFGLAIVPAVLLAAGMIVLPDSPRSLVNRGLTGEAEAVLRRIQGEAREEKRVDEIETSLERQQARWSDLLSPGLRIALAVGLGLAVFQQFVGINTVIYYAPTIFQSAGFGSDAVAILATVGVGVVNVVMTVVAMALLDRVGRRPLLLVGIAGMVASLAAMGVDFRLPPDQRGWIAVVSLMVYVAAFAISLGPIFWLMISEIYPTRVRGRAMSLATFANWGSNLLVTFTFPLLIAALGGSATFWIYGAMGILAWIFCYRLVPETKGRTLEEIEASWRTGGSRV